LTKYKSNGKAENTFRRMTFCSKINGKFMGNNWVNARLHAAVPCVSFG